MVGSGPPYWRSPTERRGTSLPRPWANFLPSSLCCAQNVTSGKLRALLSLGILIRDYVMVAFGQGQCVLENITCHLNPEV